MSNRTTKQRAWQLLQQTENQYIGNNIEAAQQTVDMAQSYVDLGVADSGNTGMTVWFSQASGGNNGYTIDYTVETVFNGSAPVNGDVTWTFDTNASPAPTANGLTASHTYASTVKSATVLVVVNKGGVTSSYSRTVKVPYSQGS